MMETRYQVRWLSKARRDELRRSGASGRGIFLDSLKGFLVVEPVGAELGDREILTAEDADFELSDAWCVEPQRKLREARRRSAWRSRPPVRHLLKRPPEKAMKYRAILRLVKETVRQWYAHDTFQLGAALAFYTVFSMAPVLIIAIGIAGLVFGKDAARRQVIDEIQQTMGSTVGAAIQNTLQYAQDTQWGTVATAVGSVVLLFGATSVFAELQTALNTVWGVKLRSDSGVWAMIKTRLLSFAVVVVIGFLLLVSLVITAGLATLNEILTPASHPGGIVFWRVVNGIVSFGFITLLFAIIYKVLPDVRINWRDVWIGAAVTALLFTVGKYLIGLYVGRSAVTSSYGAAGSLVVVLLWVYYSSQVFLFGAEFTRTYMEQGGTPVVPTDNAMRIPES